MNYSSDQETIVARCTPVGPGALALIRISGCNALAIADIMGKLASKKRILYVPSHTIHYGAVVDSDGNAIDQVMFFIMKGPRTFTGENTVEISCHNNPFIIEAILERALQSGARMAQEGEFARQAFLNNKVDLLQAEAINDLIHAQTQTALKQSLGQLRGTFSHWILDLEKSLVQAHTLCEASFEFIEETVSFDTEIKQLITSVMQKVSQLKQSYSKQSLVRDGMRVAIIGAVNAGKSSLFNTLSRRNRAIVTKQAGTTRDTIEYGVYQEGTYITFVDTAGLRTTHDHIEKEGVRRSYQEATQADILLLTVDGSRAISKEEQAVYDKLIRHHQSKIILLKTKSDLPQKTVFLSDLPSIEISSKTKMGIPLLEQHFQNKIRALLNQSKAPFLLNQRQYNLLIDLEKQLYRIAPMIIDSIEYELVSYELQKAVARFSELTGKTVTEKSINDIFRQFCVGK